MHRAHSLRFLVSLIICWSAVIFFAPNLWSAPNASSITGRVWNDANQNRTIDTGESGIGGVTVVLYNGSTCQSVQTAADGTYTFAGLPDGAYTIYEAAGETTPTPATCPPTATTADASGSTVTLGTIADPTGYASSTANVRQVTISGANLTNQNFGDYVAPPFSGCTDSAFLYQNNPSDIYTVDLVTGDYSLMTGAPAVYSNGVGYNVLDNYIYGYAYINPVSGVGYITRTDGSGNITVLPVSGLVKPGGAAASATVGDVSLDGYLYLGRANTDYAWVIDVNPQRATYLQLTMLTLSSTTGLADWAFNPADGMLYGIQTSATDPRLIQVNPTTGVVTDLGPTGMPEAGVAFGAVYFDADGYFYAASNSDVDPNNDWGDIYRIDLRDPNNLDPTATFFTQGPKSNQNDGARCALADVSALDFGDAPDSYGTSLNENGARHIAYASLFLGSLIDTEDNAWVSADALGDDGSEQDDEDGLNGGFPSLTASATTYSVQIDVANSGSPAYLVGYIDWNGDGDFGDANEQSGTVTANANGTYSVQWNVPAYSIPSATFARFRLSTDQSAVESPIGPAPDGEVEDYQAALYTPASLTIVKSAQPADTGTSFEFTQDMDASGNFSLAHGESKQFANLALGAYTVGELLPDGWQLNTITCTGNSNPVAVIAPSVEVTLESGEDVICTFANENPDLNLAVTLGWFLAESHDGVVTFSWRMETESGVAGFNLLAVTETGLVPLNGTLIPSVAIDSIAPTEYQVSLATTATTFYLQEITVDGGTEDHGPFEIGQEYGSSGNVDGASMTPAVWLPIVAR